MNRQWRLATHCACAHDMSIRPIQVEVTLYLGQNRYWKPKCRIGLLLPLIPACVNSSIVCTKDTGTTRVRYFGQSHLATLIYRNALINRELQKSRERERQDT